MNKRKTLDISKCLTPTPTRLTLDISMCLTPTPTPTRLITSDALHKKKKRRSYPLT